VTVVATPITPPTLTERAARTLLALLLDAIRDRDVVRTEPQIARHTPDE
jgi:hypothetical protein